MDLQDLQKLIPPKVISLIFGKKRSESDGNDGGYTWVGNQEPTDKIEVVLSSPEGKKYEEAPVNVPEYCVDSGNFSDPETHDCIKETQGNLIVFTCLYCDYESTFNTMTGQTIIYSDSGNYHHNHK